MACEVGTMAEIVSLLHEVIQARAQVQEGRSLGPPGLHSFQNTLGHPAPHPFHMKDKLNFCPVKPW